MSQLFMIANNQSIIYDIDTGLETPLPDIPNGVRVTNPFDGTAALLPLHPPYYIPRILVCGGTKTSTDGLRGPLGSRSYNLTFLRVAMLDNSTGPRCHLITVTGHRPLPQRRVICNAHHLSPLLIAAHHP
ncbi:hypothetical protein D9758_004683 [Tetrapyrgos nigripes]|uniref:Uncharacterized protein n=1 Tax=Tetrapyrgos nigripes TaxID=182062 RepID=A0A8H5H060_9AGAR|nr:hypothetical protein D9758_004683 [Tetrapyrgos nigripes]